MGGAVWEVPTVLAQGVPPALELVVFFSGNTLPAAGTGGQLRRLNWGTGRQFRGLRWGVGRLRLLSGKSGGAGGGVPSGSGWWALVFGAGRFLGRDRSSHVGEPASKNHTQTSCH